MFTTGGSAMVLVLGVWAYEVTIRLGMTVGVIPRDPGDGRSRKRIKAPQKNWTPCSPPSIVNGQGSPIS